MRVEKATTLNGLDTTRMFETIEAMKAQPDLARFQFRTQNRWIDGGTNRSEIQGFDGAGQEDTSRTEPFVFTNGEPPILLGENKGANPVEFLLHALAGCVTTTTVMHAAARGIEIRSITSELSGEMDLQGLLGLDENVPIGYESIRVAFQIDADCTDEELDELMRFTSTHSPVCNTVCKPVPVNITWNE